MAGYLREDFNLAFDSIRAIKIRVKLCDALFRSSRDLRRPVTVAVIVPPPIRNILQIREIFCGKCPTVIRESFFAATTYLSTTLPISRLQNSCSSRTAVYISPYT